jgi:hypothetical protein
MVYALAREKLHSIFAWSLFLIVKQLIQDDLL